MKYSIILSLFFLCGCTYSITMVHTEGQANDIVDEAQTPSTSVSPNIDIPLTKISPM